MIGVSSTQSFRFVKKEKYLLETITNMKIKKKKKTEKGIFDSKFSNEMQGELYNDSFAVTTTSSAYRICPISQMNGR